MSTTEGPPMNIPEPDESSPHPQTLIKITLVVSSHRRLCLAKDSSFHVIITHFYALLIYPHTLNLRPSYTPCFILPYNTNPQKGFE